MAKNNTAEPAKVKKTITQTVEVEVIPSSRTGKTGDDDAVQVELFVGGKKVESITVDDQVVDLTNYYALPEDLRIIESGFVQRKRKKKADAPAAAGETSPSESSAAAASDAQTESAPEAADEQSDAVEDAEPVAADAL